MAEELLCTVSDVVSAWAPFATVNSTEQTSLIKAASEAILNYCRRDGFVNQTVTELHDGKNVPRLWLNVRPVLGVAAITINGDAIGNTDGTAWGFNTKTGELWRHQGYHDQRFGRWFPRGRQNIQVTYYAGYPEVPSLVKRACVFMVQYLSDQIKANGVYASESIGDYSYSLNTAKSGVLPPSVANLLFDYIQDDCFA